MTDARQKLLDFAEYDVGIAQPWEMIGPRQFDKTRSRNSFRHIAAGPEFDRQIMRAMQKQCRDADGGQNVPNVDFCVHRDEHCDPSRTYAHSQHPTPPLCEALIPNHAGGAFGEPTGAPHSRRILAIHTCISSSVSPNG